MPMRWRDWAELPQDALATVLGKLAQAEILAGAGQVCGSWRRAAADEPALWRRVEARSPADLAVARLALRRSAGRCEEFLAEGGAGNDDFLLDLAEQAPSLKSLRLISCSDVSNEGFAEAIKKFPMLEELELSLCENVFGQQAFETVGKACPQLKRFRLNKPSFWTSKECNIDEEALGIATMTELRSLQIFGNNLSSTGLTSILDSCPHLEALDIRHCFRVIWGDSLGAKYARIKALRRPRDPIDDYEFDIEPDWDDVESVYDDIAVESDYDDIAVESDYVGFLNAYFGESDDELDEENEGDPQRSACAK